MSEPTTVLLVAIGLLWVAAGTSAALVRSGIGLRVAAGLSFTGGAGALTAGVMELVDHAVVRLELSSGVAGAVALVLTPLGAVFLVALGLVAMAIAANVPRSHRAGPGTGTYLVAYHLALVASLLILLAGTVTVFLVAWETMTAASYIVVLRHHRARGVTHGAFLFIALGEVGFAMVVAAFAILAVRTGSLDFAVIHSHARQVGSGWEDAVFLLVLLGFAFKAGFIPLHLALPEADPVAPPDGAAFLSAIVTKLAVYGICLVSFRLLPAGPVWWGLTAMSLGAASAVLGVLYSLMERDWKRFLAYSTIENLGIILIAVGGALTFMESGQPAIAALLLIAALYHVLNHSTYKALLFLQAGVVEAVTGLRDLDRLGGLMRRMPRTAWITLVGTVGIAALPPLNGFVSEWLVFQGLFQGFRIQSHLVAVLLVVTAACLALTGGLAVNAFARMFGIPFLGMPRSNGAALATDQGQPVVGGALLAVACVLLALGAPVVLTGLDGAVASATGVNILSTLVVPGLTVIPAHTNFSSFSPTYLAVCLVAMLAVPLLLVRLRRRGAADRTAPVWAGGIYRFRPRMQYTATTHANPVRVTFDELYRPHIEVSRASDEPAGQSGPVHYGFRVTPLFERYLYQPVIRLVEAMARRAQPIQSGDLNLYLLYVLAAILVAYAVAVR
ncbi:MAG: proton-conducting transporter transmembrane domain-containing protein [Candidatus Dormibacteria bacterium]